MMHTDPGESQECAIDCDLTGAKAGVEKPGLNSLLYLNPNCVPVVRDRMQRQRVQSESIISVGYDRSTRAVEVEFTGGAVYRYAPVPAYVYRGLLDAPSKGAYVNTVLKPRYKSEGPLKD